MSRESDQGAPKMAVHRPRLSIADKIALGLTGLGLGSLVGTTIEAQNQPPLPQVTPDQRGSVPPPEGVTFPEGVRADAPVPDAPVEPVFSHKLFLPKVEQKYTDVPNLINILSLPDWDRFRNITERRGGSLIINVPGTELFIADLFAPFSPGENGFELVARMHMEHSRDGIPPESLNANLTIHVNPSFQFIVEFNPSRSLKLSILDRSEPGISRFLTFFSSKKSPEVLNIQITGVGEEERWHLSDASNGDIIARDIKPSKPLRSDVQDKVYFGFYAQSMHLRPTLIVDQLTYKPLP